MPTSHHVQIPGMLRHICNPELQRQRQEDQESICLKKKEKEEEYGRKRENMGEGEAGRGEGGEKEEGERYIILQTLRVLHGQVTISPTLELMLLRIRFKMVFRAKSPVSRSVYRDRSSETACPV